MNNSSLQMAQVKGILAGLFSGLSGVIRSIRAIHILLLLLALPFLLALSTVFVVSHELANGVVSGKYFWFYGSICLASLAAFVAAFVGKFSIRFSALDGMLLLFAGSVYLPAFLFSGAAPNASRLTLLTLLLVFYFSCRILFGVLGSKPASRNFFYGFIMLTGLVEAAWGLLQLYGFTPSQHALFKLTGSFFNSGPYAGYLAMVFPIALHFTLRPLPLALRSLPAITCIALLLVLPAAMSRASWIAVIAGSLVALIGQWSADGAGRSGLRRFLSQYFPKGKTRSYPPGPRYPRSIARCLLACAAMLLVGIAAVGMYHLKKDSADGRMLTWKVSLQVIASHPFGAGLGNFSGAYGEEQAAYFASGRASEAEAYVAGNPEYGFNEYLQIAIESGVIAFLLFIGVIALAIRSKIKANDWGALGSFVALLVFAGFSYPFSVLPFLIVFTLLLAVGQCSAGNTHSAGFGEFISLKYSRLQTSDHLPNPHFLRSIALALCCLLVAAGCLWKQLPAYRAYRQWKNNQIYYQSGLFEDMAEAYGALYPHLNDRIQFLFEYAQSLSKAGLNDKLRAKSPARCDSLLNKSNEVLRCAMQISCDPMLYNVMGKNCQAMKAYPKAEACYLQSGRLVPSRLYPWYLLTKLYDEMGLKDKVREAAAIVCTKEPKVQSPAVVEMREEARKLIMKINN